MLCEISFNQSSVKNQKELPKRFTQKKVIFLELRMSNKNLIDEASQSETISLGCIFHCFLEGIK
jgi:hypothetical protein